jgi:radical SAM protein with 4Fe4S-binding SPASM domain
MMSAYDNNFWNIKDTSMKEVFQSDFVKKQLNNGFLPKECHDCKHKEECRG